MIASVDTCRMAETGTGSGRSPSGAVLTVEAADALQPLDLSIDLRGGRG
jgi:hypothetical protein